tara:strand:- start:28776 stop:29771 length:996 start_codon:yes stop_codon:yes gene_type:complete
MSKIITHLYRGKIIESTHRVKCLIQKINGEKIYSTNNENDYIFPRSSIKVFQAIPFAYSKAIEKFQLNNKQIALSCSSHCAEWFHAKEIESWLQKIKIKKNKLRCGIHNPLDKKSSENLFVSGKKPNQIHNNCSGKHLGMLSACLAEGYSTEDYLDFNHKHQRNIRNIFENFTETKILKSNFGIDGCSAPQYAFKIKDIQNALINLYKSFNSKFKFNSEVQLLIKSIIENPKYIGGTLNLDSNLIKISKGQIFCKGGAEGVFLFCHLTKGITGVIKIEDGNERALKSVMYELSKKFNLLDNIQLKKFLYYGNFDITNHAKLSIGKTKTILK